MIPCEILHFAAI